MKASQHNHKPLRRMVIVAAAAALILAFSLTAYATDLFGLMDLIMPDSYQSSSLPDDAVEGASTREHISISGFSNTPEAKASAEWKQYYDSYDFSTVEWDKDDLPQNASYYGAYNYEMYNKLKEIANNYGLELLDGVTVGTRTSYVGSDREAYYYQYSNGSFKEEDTYTTSDGTSIGYSLIRNVYGSLATTSFEIWDSDNWTEWSFTTDNGQQVLLALSDTLYSADGSELGKRGLIIADLGTCFVTTILTQWDDPITAVAMNEMVRNIDFAQLAAIE